MSNWKLTSINMDMLDDWYTLSECMVYSRLWWYAYHTDECDCPYPSEQKIANDLRLSTRQVVRAILTLEDNGLIEVYRRWLKKINSYTVCSLYNYPCKIEYFLEKST